jgi:hypothetical protein
MNCGSNITTTRRDGWRDQCRTWAETGAFFSIHQIDASHLAFCKQLCDNYGYECTYASDHADSAAFFGPCREGTRRKLEKPE